MARKTSLTAFGAMALVIACKTVMGCPTGDCVSCGVCGVDDIYNGHQIRTSKNPTQGGGGPNAGPDATTTVHVYSNNFSINASGGAVVDPTINLGDTVHWQWDASSHSVTSVAGSLEVFDTTLHGSGFTFDHTFTHTGVFPYYCENHGSDNGNGTASGMSGTVTVIDPTTSTWNVNASANWDTAGSWFGNVPNTVGIHAVLGTNITAARTVTLNTARTVGYLTFNNANKFTMSGTGSLTLDVASGSGTIEVLNGNHTINPPVVFADNSTIAVTPAASTLLMTGQMSAGAGVMLTKTGAGTLEMKNVRGAGLTVNTGTVVITASGATTSTSNVTGLSIAAGARVNVNNNDLVVNYSGASPVTAITGLVATGYASGAWTGNGLTSASAAATSASADKTALGIAEASDLFTTFPATFSGQSVDNTSVLVLYTLSGDANLDSAVSSADFNLLASNFGTSGQRWAKGDFTFDGTVNSADFNALASNFGKTLASGPGASVPEPAALTGGVALATLFVARRRLRK